MPPTTARPLRPSLPPSPFPHLQRDDKQQHLPRALVDEQVGGHERPAAADEDDAREKKQAAHRREAARDEAQFEAAARWQNESIAIRLSTIPSMRTLDLSSRHSELTAI